MKAFKLIACILALLLCFSGCSCARNEDVAEDVKDVQTTQTAPQNTEAPKDTGAENKTDAEKNDKVKLYYAMQAEGELNTSYHIEDCKATKGVEVMEINSDFVTMIGLNPCKRCNPPKF